MVLWLIVYKINQIHIEIFFYKNFIIFPDILIFVEKNFGISSLFENFLNFTVIITLGFIVKL